MVEESECELQSFAKPSMRGVGNGTGRLRFARSSAGFSRAILSSRFQHFYRDPEAISQAAARPDYVMSRSAPTTWMCESSTNTLKRNAVSTVELENY